MAEEIINIATLTIDKTEANKSIVETKQQIFELQKANSDLRKDISKNGDVTGEQTKKFVENEQQLKKLNTEYKAQSAAVNDLTLAELKSTKALTDTAKSRDQAIAQTKELKTIRGQLNTETAEGAQALELLNAKIDANDKFLKNSASSQEKASTITGNYRQKIFELGDSLAETVPGFTQARTVVQGFSSIIGESSDKVTGYANSAIQSTKATLGFKTSTQLATEASATQTVATEAQTVATEAQTVATSASVGSLKLLKLAIIGTGIGALVILLVAVTTALSQNEGASNKFTKALAGLKGILNAVFAVLRPLGEFLIDKIVGAFDIVGRTAEKALGLVSSGLAALGFDKAAKSVDNFTKSTKASIQATQQLSAEEAKFTKAQRLAQKIQLDYQNQAEKLRQIRDDESKSTAQRIEANKQLGETLKKQASDELRIANQGTAIANLRIKLTGESTDNLNALAEAQTRVSDIQERISGQESEQLTNLNSLRKESADKAKAIADTALQNAVKNREADIALQRAKNAQLNQTDAERLEFLNLISKEEIGLIEFKKSKGVISEKEAQLASLAILKAQSSETLALAQKTIDDEIEAQAKKVEEKKKLSEQDRIDGTENATFLRDVQVKRIEESKLLESEKAIALADIQKGYLASVATIDQNYKESKKAQDEIDRQEAQTLADVAVEMRLLALEEQGLSEAEVQLATLEILHDQKRQALDQDLALEKKTAEEVTALKTLEDKKYAVATKKIDDQVAATKRKATAGIVQNSLAAASLIFGESKALSVASALVNTYQGITAELSTKAVTPYEIGLKVANVAFVAASGFAAVKNILKTEKGGGGGGSTSTGVSTPAATFENVARTQTVASVNAPPAQDATQQNQPVLILETLSEAQKNQIIKINSQ